MVTLRDLRRRPVASGPLAAVAARYSRRVPLTRALLALAADGVALLTLVWEDDTTAVCTVRDGHACDRWLALQPWAAGRVHVAAEA
jgi:hypothetical protein